MADVWLKSFYKHRAVVRRNVGTAQSERGMVQEAWETVGTHAGRFFVERNRVPSERLGSVVVMDSYWQTDGGNEIDVGYRLTSVTDADGGAIGSHPFDVTGVEKAYDERGRLHHKVCHLEAVEAD